MKLTQPGTTEAEARVAEAEKQAAALVAWIAELRRLHYDTAEATASLVAVTDRLLRCYEDHARSVQELAAKWP